MEWKKCRLWITKFEDVLFWTREASEQRRMIKWTLWHAGHTDRARGLFNPLPALTLQSAPDLNVPCSKKWSKALLLTQKNRIFFKKEDVFTFRTKPLNPLPVRLKVLLHALTGCVFQWHSWTTWETGLPSRKKKIITIKLKKTEW
jgi:hypothetical protein